MTLEGTIQTADLQRSPIQINSLIPYSCEENNEKTNIYCCNPVNVAIGCSIAILWPQLTGVSAQFMKSMGPYFSVPDYFR